MQEELRKYETNLLISGMADIAFGAWSLIKAVLYLLLSKNKIWELIPQAKTDRAVFMVIVWFVMLIAAFDCALRVYVGFSARAQARGKKKGPGYLIAAFLLMAVLFVSIAASFRADSYTVSSVIDIVVTVLLDLTSLGALIETIGSAFRVRNLRKQLG